MLRQMCGVLVLENKCFAIASCQSIVAKPNCFGFSSIIFEAKNETKDKKKCCWDEIHRTLNMKLILNQSLSST